MKLSTIATVIALTASMSANAGFFSASKNAGAIESGQVNAQQKQYAKVQPVPFMDWSLERDQVIRLYNLRNIKAATHTVWRGNTSVIEGDCPSIGFGIPYDTSLTNPQVSVDRANNNGRGDSSDYSLTSVGQAEPNGVYASTNTSATWVMCVNPRGQIEPVYVEAKVTGYPYAVDVNYSTGRVTRKSGSKAVILK